MEFSNSIDDLLAQLDCKIPEEEVAADVSDENTDNDEYINFVMEEIIKGNASLDATESTLAAGSSTPQSEIFQHQDANPGVGSAVVNPGTFSGLQPNMYPITASYISNGKPVVVFANTVATSTASGQTLTSAGASSASQSASLSSGPCAAVLLKGNHVEMQSVFDHQSQNMVIVAQPPLVSQPQGPSAAAILTSNPNKYILTNALVSSLNRVQNTPFSQSHGSTVSAAVVPKSEAASVTSTPERSENKKRKLYEEPQSNDPLLEKRRKNAQNAKNHREKIKLKIKELSEELEQTRNEKEEFKKENEELRLQVAQHEEVKREIQALRLDNERLRAQEQAWAQRDKLGLENFDLFDLLQ